MSSSLCAKARWRLTERLGDVASLPLTNFFRPRFLLFAHDAPQH